MPGAVVDVDRGSDGRVATDGADTEHKFSVHDGRAPVCAAAADFAVHETFAGPPLRAGAARGVRGTHMATEVVCDGTGTET
jgi:hypothetical protein